MTGDMLLGAGSWLVGSAATEIGDAQLEIRQRLYFQKQPVRKPDLLETFAKDLFISFTCTVFVYSMGLTQLF
jgi:hypothetical protein